MHVIGDGELKINIEPVPPQLDWVVGMSRADIRRAARLVREHRDMLLAR